MFTLEHINLCKFQLKPLLLFFSLISIQSFSQYTNISNFQNTNYNITKSLKNAKNIISLSQYQFVSSSSDKLDYRNEILEYQFNNKGELSSLKRGYRRIQSVEHFERFNDILTIKEFDGSNKLLKTSKIKFNQKGEFLNEYYYDSENKQVGTKNYIFDNTNNLVEIQEINQERSIFTKIGGDKKLKSRFYRYKNGDSTTVFYFYEGNKVISKTNQVHLKSKDASYDSYIEDTYDDNNQVIESYSKFENLEARRTTFK